MTIVNMHDGNQITTEDLMNYLKKAIQDNDGSYAWAWHCNIAMMAYDAGTEHKMANDGAARFMKLAFGVDTTQFDEYKEIMNYKEDDE